MNGMKQVLIVDDEADVLWMLQKSLNKGMPDVDLLVAASGEEALAVLASDPVDLVITDINMPGMNGLDLLVEINNKYPHIGVIVITAYPSSAYQSQAILAGSLKFIEKPFDIKYLRKIVEEFLNDKKNGFQGTISGIDLIDIVQFNGLSRATAALKVTNDSSTGMIFFKDGQVVHAICDQMQGEKAFFTILGFHGGNLKNIKGVEAPLMTISKSLELLLLEATSSDDEVMDEEMPFLSYEELVKEPPPAFLSQRQEEGEKSFPEEEAPLLLFNDVDAGQTVAVLDALDADGLPAEIPGVDSEDDPDEWGKAYLAKTSSIPAAELRNQRTALAGKTSASPETAIPGRNAGDRKFSQAPVIDPDSPAFLSDAGEKKPPAALVAPPAEASSPAAVSRPLARQQHPPAGKNASKGAQAAAKPAKQLSPIDSILAEFIAIDGVRLACLVGRNGFLLASQPEGNSSYAEALSAIAASGLASTELMGEELARRSSLQTGLFEYQDSMIILSPVGEDSFLMVVAEDDTNLGWLRLVIRKNANRIKEINASS